MNRIISKMKNRLFTPYKIRVTTIPSLVSPQYLKLFTPYKIRVTTILMFPSYAR